MKSWLTISLVGLFVICPAVPASAQVEEVTPGDRVRILAPGISDTVVTGRVTEISDSSMSISPSGVEGQYESIAVPYHVIRTLEVSRQVRRTGHGALWGAGIGGFSLGFVWMTSASGDDFFGSGQSNGELFWEGARAGLVLGGLIGAVVGTAKKKEKWKRVPVRISVPPVTLQYPQGERPVTIPTLSVRLPFSRVK